MGGEDEAKRDLAIANERAKLLANALDRSSAACITVGILGPTAAALYGLGAALPGRGGAFYAGTAMLRPLAALLLHLMARHVLGTLR
ncbi:hypothetical protein MKK68_25415 [Methylobacterium sp. E-016]|uniref:hypothetical protein n=1 Tax=Methylobacterium sp. E-016 TaxID=2836556 RepID=UPI001FBB139C|nr:hypothetical protein [Methylobacterium sp. E-016]MCJ2078930.1 hypothetical protein [Methylobacterium sp. E-016]